MSINELFGNEGQENATSGRMLDGTAELTRISNGIAVNVIRSMEAEIDIYRERISKSASDAREMDKLLDEFRPWADIEEDNQLRSLDDETVESMLKSQQSKRSRLKGKAMTLDNYTQMMTATIAETLLREMYGKPKSAHISNRRANALNYTPAELESFSADQEALKREIRNIQSKKSIMKAKEGFDESSEQWQMLLKAELMLKDLRIGGRGTTVVEVDHTKDRLAELLANVDVDDLKAHDSKDLLNSIKEMLQ